MPVVMSLAADAHRTGHRLPPEELARVKDLHRQLNEYLAQPGMIASAFSLRDTDGDMHWYTFDELTVWSERLVWMSANVKDHGFACFNLIRYEDFLPAWVDVLTKRYFARGMYMTHEMVSAPMPLPEPVDAPCAYCGNPTRVPQLNVRVDDSGPVRVWQVCSDTVCRSAAWIHAERLNVGGLYDCESSRADALRAAARKASVRR